MGTVIQDLPRGNEDRSRRWDRRERADLFARDGDRKAQGVSQRQAATGLEVPRTTLQAWRASQESLAACPAGVAFFHRVPGLAFLHRLVLALPVVSPEVGACGMRLGCLCLPITRLARFVGASSGAQHQVKGRVAEAIVADRREERARLAHAMPAKDMTVAQEQTCTGGLCLLGIEPVSNFIVLEQAAQARDHDPWHTRMEQALAGRNCRVIPSPSEEAPGLLAYVAHHLGAHHAPDLFHVQPALSKAVSAPMAATQRVAAKAAPQADETLKRGQERLDTPDTTSEKRGPGRPPKATLCLEHVVPQGAAAHHEQQRLSEQRETVTQSIRAMGRASHWVDVERGVRRHGKRLAGDIQRHIATIRTVAQHEHLSETCLERLEKAERVVPTMPATIAFVSTSVRQQVSQRGLTQPASSAMPAPLLPASSLERVATPKTVREGHPLRECAARIRTPLCDPGGVWHAWPQEEHNRLQAEAAKLADVFQRSSAHVEGRNGDLSLRNPP